MPRMRKPQRHQFCLFFFLFCPFHKKRQFVYKHNTFPHPPPRPPGNFLAFFLPPFFFCLPIGCCATNCGIKFRRFDNNARAIPESIRIKMLRFLLSTLHESLSYFPALHGQARANASEATYRVCTVRFYQELSPRVFLNYPNDLNGGYCPGHADHSVPLSGTPSRLSCNIEGQLQNPQPNLDSWQSLWTRGTLAAHRG